jgi:hypothetical protein
MNTRTPLCPCPTKTVFRTEETARRALERISYSNPVMPIAYYHCRCGRWHLTSQQQM